jgi:hypothetical protein
MRDELRLGGLAQGLFFGCFALGGLPGLGLCGFALCLLFGGLALRFGFCGFAASLFFGRSARLRLCGLTPRFLLGGLTGFGLGSLASSVFFSGLALGFGFGGFAPCLFFGRSARLRLRGLAPRFLLGGLALGFGFCGFASSLFFGGLALGFGFCGFAVCLLIGGLAPGFRLRGFAPRVFLRSLAACLLLRRPLRAPLGLLGVDHVPLDERLPLFGQTDFQTDCGLFVLRDPPRPLEHDSDGKSK